MTSKKLKKVEQATEALRAPEVEEADAFVTMSKADVDKAIVQIKALEIVDAQTYEMAAEMLKAVAQRFTVHDGKRKSLVERLKSITSEIDAMFRPVTKGLRAAEEILKEKIAAWKVHEYNARAAATVAALAAPTHQAAAQIIASAPPIAKTDGVGESIYWTGEVVDATLIPREYCIPDVAKLEALTEALGKDPAIPGWRAKQTAQVRTTRRG